MLVAPASPPIPTLAEYADAWRARRARHWSPRTQAGYEEKLRLHVLPVLGAIPLDALEKRDLVAHFDALSLRFSPATMMLIVGIVTACLNDAVDADVIGRNPATRLIKRYSERPREAACYSPDELAHFLAVGYRMAPDWARLFAVMAKTGARAGEARALALSDFDRDAGLVRIERQLCQLGNVKLPKFEKTRRVPYFGSLEPWLDEYALRPGVDRLQPDAAGRHGYKRMLRAFAAIATAAKLPAFTPKTCRHHYASHLLSLGESLEVVRRALGHADPRTTTRIYGGHYELVRSPLFRTI